MDKRSYNIFFDLHTVTGIVISVLLYVIFFAGSFSFFRSEIIAWERNEPAVEYKGFSFNVDTVLDTLEDRYDLSGREVYLHKHASENRLYVTASAPRDTTLGKERLNFYLHPDTFKEYTYENSYTLGEFLYQLHFFAQLTYPVGYFLSGFTSLFFLFAILTGILVHWKKIISNFYLFRPWEKLKTVWTDAHTALGTIGLPFQVVYAITGCFFMINILLVLPSLGLLYNGDQDKFYQDLGYGSAGYTFENNKLAERPPLNKFVHYADSSWNGAEITEVTIYNYGDQSMHITVGGEAHYTDKFTGFGEVTFKAADGTLVHEKQPSLPTSYLDGVKGALYHLHFADYGGYAVKGISFLLGLVTCFVIITGILVWLEARNKKSILEKQKRFNQRVGYIYLAICLTMYPVTAFSFIVTHLLPDTFDEMRMTILYSVYFGSWLLASIGFTLKKDNFFTNKYTLLSGALLGCFIPFVNGIVKGNWLWNSLVKGQVDIFAVDLLWILISAAAFYAVAKLKSSPKVQIETDESVIATAGQS